MNVLKKNNDKKYINNYKYSHFLSLNLFFTNNSFKKNKKPMVTSFFRKSKSPLSINYISYKYGFKLLSYGDSFFKINHKNTLEFKKYKELIFLKSSLADKSLIKFFLQPVNKNFKKIIVTFNYKPCDVTKALKNKCNFDTKDVKIEQKISFSKNLFFKKKDVFSLMDSQIMNFLMFLFNKNIFFIFKKLNPSSKHVEFDSEARYIIWKMMSKYHKKIDYQFMRTFYKVLFFSFKLKDPNFFLDWYINILELTGSNKHKFLIHILYILLKKFHKYIFFSSNIKGMFFYISGKIGVSGNSKKRNIFFNFGKHSGTKKNLRVNSTKSIVKTLTGALGVTFNIYF